MRTLINVFLMPLRAMKRLGLAVKFYLRLGYSWHLAWTKAAR